MHAGKSVDEAVAAVKVPAKFPGYVASVNGTFGGPKANTRRRAFSYLPGTRCLSSSNQLATT